MHCILRDVINGVNFLFIGPRFDSIVLAPISRSNCYITQGCCIDAAPMLGIFTCKIKLQIQVNGPCQTYQVLQSAFDHVPWKVALYKFSLLLLLLLLLLLVLECFNKLTM